MLTKKQKILLDYIKNYVKRNDYAPTLEEIKRRFRLSSVATIHEHVDDLIERGYLKKERGRHRAIEIIKKHTSTGIPLVGTVRAGNLSKTTEPDLFPTEQLKNLVGTNSLNAAKSISDEKYLTNWLNKIICVDCVEGMKKLPDKSIDLVVTSPPYDKIRKYNGFSYNLHEAGKEIFRILKDGGIAAMVIQDQTKNFGKSLTSFRTVIDWCDSFGFKLFETVIYRKYGAEGAWWNKRFRVDHEYVPIFLKGERPRYFNKEPLKIPSKHGGKTMTGGGTRLTNGIRIATRAITINPMKCRGTIWEYLTAGDGTRLKHQHPATFPDKLPVDLIQCFCPTNGIVLDPFMGSGTTAIAAKKIDKDFIGFDVSQVYCDLANKRLKEEVGATQNKIKFP